MLISIIVTVKNEEESMPHLLDSLIVQEKPVEVIIVDSNSDDKTQEIVKKYSKKYDFIKLLECDAHKSKSRNYGVKHSNGDAVAFTDGSCIANPFWIKEIREKLNKGFDVVAGKTIQFGFTGFSKLKRVPLYHKGGDASYPTCNIAYKKELFEKINGFDPWLKEAEDVDINYRALDNNAKFIFNNKAIIYHLGSETVNSFIKKSFWYGFGRKELAIKHGSLWKSHNVLDMFKIDKEESIWKFIRNFFGFLGYLFGIIIAKNPEKKEKLRKSNISKH